jgi:hypothetical protein
VVGGHLSLQKEIVVNTRRKEGQKPGITMPKGPFLFKNIAMLGSVNEVDGIPSHKSERKGKV